MFKRKKFKSELEYEPLLSSNYGLVDKNDKLILSLMAVAFFICCAGILFGLTMVGYIYFAEPSVSWY